MLAILLFTYWLCACLTKVQSQNNNITQLDSSSSTASNLTSRFHTDAVSLHPGMHEIVMVGHRSTIKIVCEKLKQKQNIRLSATLDSPLANIKPDHILCLLNASKGEQGEDVSSTIQHLELIGVLPGQTILSLQARDPDNNDSEPALLTDTYVITVVERVDVARDAFMYVLSMVKFFTLLMLGFRMRSEAVKEILTRPCALINAILCQTALLPLITLGCSLALSLPIHSVVCLLVLGCCPTGILSPVFAVLQQSHVELAIILTVIETIAAFGAVPGWLFAYGHFLGVAYSQVSFPYLHIAGALGYVAGPILLGMALKRCVKGPLQQFDKSIQPVCLLVAMIAVTVSISELLHLWVHVTWQLLLGCALLPVGGFVVGIIVNAIFRQKLPQLKSVAIVTSIQNTLLARVILQTSYPAEDSSLMRVTIVCVEAMTLGLMVVVYVIHVIVWLSCQRYRVSHDSVGISGLQCSIGERLVKNMVKAGEIRFCNRERNRPGQNHHNSSSGGSASSAPPSSVDTIASKVSKISERNILNNRASSFTQKTLGSVNKAFSTSFDSLGRTSQVINAGPTTGESTLNYFGSGSGGSDDHHTRTPTAAGDNSGTKEINKDKDTLSIDYDMLTLSKNKNTDKNKNIASPGGTGHPDHTQGGGGGSQEEVGGGGGGHEDTGSQGSNLHQSAPICADNIGLIEYNYKQ